METSVETQKTDKVSWGPYQLRPNPIAILRLSFFTAGAISTALLIPDIISTLPTAPDAYTLVCRAVGLWGYCYALWTTGFLCILHLVRIFSGGIQLDKEGIKLGRLAKKVAWDSIEAVTITERAIFSKVFFVPAYMMTLHIRKAESNSWKRVIGGDKQIASFMYLPEEFSSLFYYVSKLSTGAEPRSIKAVVFDDIKNPDLKKFAEGGRLKSVALTALIAFGLVVFLGRKAVLNYTFNMGNKEFYAGHYDKAIANYSTASSVEFSFAPAWDRLARSEYRVGDAESAEEHWKEALKWKPDLVESKLGLSKIYIMRGQLDKANELIQSANRLASTDEAAYINRALIDSLMGKNHLAIEELEAYVKQNVGRELATGILARCYLREGELDKADSLLKSNPEILKNPYTRPFCTAVLAEIQIARGNFNEAAKLLHRFRQASNYDPDLLIDLAKIEIGRKNFESAKGHLNKAIKINADNPWAALLMADAEASSGGSSADFWYERAMNFKYTDPCLMAAAAEYLKKHGKNEQALALANKALKIDPANLIARNIVMGEPE